jgi:uncharacterized protein
MIHVILLHGRPDKEEYFDETLPKPHEAHWFPWLKSELEARGMQTDIPIMPRPYEPDYEEWKKVFETYTLTQETILVGHSRGAHFLLQYFSEKNIVIKSLILVAPTIAKTEGITNFTNQIDSLISERTSRISLLYSTDDNKNVLESVRKIKVLFPTIIIKEFTEAKHFRTMDGYSIFPELLEEIVK